MRCSAIAERNPDVAAVLLEPVQGESGIHRSA
jgi:acetylornithine/succinyldiaminopimelate/putrescine aminotransferase